MNWNWLPHFLRHNTPNGTYDVHKTVQQLLSSLQVTWELEGQNEKESEQDYHFHFQNGDFHLYAREGRSYARIHFLFFLEMPFGQLDNVRHACNQFSINYAEYKVVYSINPNQHIIHLHVTTSFRLSPYSEKEVRDFGNTLAMCFEAARSYQQILDSIRATDTDNLEEHNAMTDRDIFLLREAEISHQNKSFSWRSNETEHQSLGQVMRTLLDGQELHFSRLTVVANDTFTTTDIEKIEHFDLSSVLVRQDNDTALFVCENATLVVEAATDGKATSDYIVHLRAEDESAGVLYFRFDLLLPSESYSTSLSDMARSLSPSSSHTVLLAYDAKDTKERLAEFTYQWEEMLETIKKQQPLSREQQFLQMTQIPNVGYNLYWGRRFFESRRYYDALRHLENAYYSLNFGFHQFGETSRETFYELSYYIGFCYSELKMFKQAYFFLDICFSQKSIRYAMEYVNVLVNSCDFRALHVINSLIEHTQPPQPIDDSEDNDEATLNTKRFLAFLHRRKGHTLIDLDMLDQAEKIFQELLKDPESEDYALKELAYIQQLRERNTPQS